MSLYSQFKTDQDAEKKGIVLDYGPNSKGQPIQIRIARAGGSNLAYTKAMEAKVKPYRRQLQNETMEAALIRGLLIDVYARTIVLSWANVEDEAGKPLDFTAENCIKVFTDLPDLFDDVQEQSQRSALFRAEMRDNDSKN